MYTTHFTERVSADPAGGLAGWATDLMELLGAPGAGLAVALENLFPPLPSEVILPLAGFTASQGELRLLDVIAWTTLGSLAGAVVLYYLGALLGRDRLRAVVVRMPLVDVADLDRSEAWFAAHGRAAVFFGRMVPIVRSLVSVPAGIERMRFSIFVGLTAAGSLLWNTVFILAGYQLGENWGTATSYAGGYAKLVAAAALLTALFLVGSRLRRARRRRRDPNAVR
jgi:membrane protein DedA with SNARE-associated domain